MRLLLIDDELSIKAFVERSMPQGSTLDYAQTCEEGLKLLDTCEYDLILADLHMAGMTDGDALTAVLQKSSHVPVMVLTQLHFPAYAASLIRQGATWVHFKPDSSVEPVLAERLLGESMIFCKARHDAQRRELASASATTSAIERLEREVRDLLRDRERIAVLEEQHVDTEDEWRRLSDRIDAQRALQLAKDSERERGKWGMWAKIVGIVGTGLAAIIGPWAASRWK
jgi:DNA-binding NarL/FixJ family response regulator